MKKAGRMALAVWGLLLCQALGGCSAREFLTEIPREYALTGGEAAEEQAGTQTEEKAGTQAEEKAGTQAERVSFLEEGFWRYAYGTLTEAEAVWYRDIEEILGRFGEKERLSGEGLALGLTGEDISRIFQCVMNDHPELFYVDGYSYVTYTRGNALTGIEFSGNYNVDYGTGLKRRAEIREAAAEALEGISRDAPDYEKVRYVYEWVITSTDYNLEAEDNQNIYSVFINHSSVCQGYAKAAQYLLNSLGVDCTLVQGTVYTGERHGWNLVRVDGSFYYMDTTWGDASYRMEETEEGRQQGMPEISYEYLNITTEELLRTHTLDVQLSVPECTAVEANYYRREGALFSEYDREQLQALADRAAAQGKNSIALKCRDEGCYEEMTKALIEGQEIFRYLETDGGSVAYARNERQLSLTFWVTNQ